MKTEKTLTIEGIACRIVKRSGRKNINISINLQGECEIRTPIRCPEELVRHYVKINKDWIKRAIEEKKTKPNYGVSEEKTEELREKTKRIVPQKIAYYCERMGVEPPEKITITSAKTRWGSCTSKRHINISLYLMLYPDEAIDYVIVHEIAHLKELNHSEKFWRIVEKELPDYRKRRAMLR